MHNLVLQPKARLNLHRKKSTIEKLTGYKQGEEVMETSHTAEMMEMEDSDTGQCVPGPSDGLQMSDPDTSLQTTNSDTRLQTTDLDIPLQTSDPDTRLSASDCNSAEDTVVIRTSGCRSESDTRLTASQCLCNSVDNSSGSSKSLSIPRTTVCSTPQEDHQVQHKCR
jgi:hypothetical protein